MELKWTLLKTPFNFVVQSIVLCDSGESCRKNERQHKISTTALFARFIV